MNLGLKGTTVYEYIINRLKLKRSHNHNKKHYTKIDVKMFFDSCSTQFDFLQKSPGEEDKRHFIKHFKIKSNFYTLLLSNEKMTKTKPIQFLKKYENNI